MYPEFTEGQRVRIIELVDGFGRVDPRVRPYAGRTGRVVRSFYLSANEMWEKTLRLEDVYCYDIRLDGEGGVVGGLPEPALEAFNLLRE